MNLNDNVCPICSIPYNDSDRLPRIFITCGHTACSSCLTSYSIDQDIICPIDGTRIPHEGKGIELLPPNYALLRVIETKQEPTSCKEHKKKLRFICLDDGAHMCEDCTYYGRHRGHQVKLLKDAESECKKKIEKLEDAFEAYDTYWKGIDKIFDDTRTGLLKTVKEECQNLRWLLLMKELELSYLIDSFFKTEKAKVAENFGYKSTARKEIEKKIEKFKSVLEAGEHIKIIKDDISPLITALKFEELHQKTHDLRKGFEETRQAFDADFITRVQPFIVLLDFPAEELSTKAEVIYFEENDSIPLKRKPERNQIVSVSELAQNMMRSGNQERSFLLNTTNVDDVRKATMRFVNQESREEVDKLIYPLWQMFRDTLSVKIDFAGKTISDCEFFDSCLYTAWSADSLQKFELMLQNSNIRDYSIVPLISEILPRMPKLKTISMDLSSTGITDKSIGAFPANTLSSVQDLESLELNLSKTLVTDQSISELFTHVKGIRKLMVSVESTQVSDDSILRFAKNALPAMRYLEDLKLDLSNTKVSDQSIVQMFHSVKTVKRLMLNLSWTQITSQSLDAFISHTLPYTKVLENFELYVSGTRVVLENIIHLFLCMYNRKHLDAVKLREDSLEVSINYPLSIAKNLETLEIDLSATRTTDDSIRPIFVGIDTVKTLKLVLSFTNITDETIETFVRQMLSTARSLTVLEINLSNTRVTDEGLAALFVRMENIVTFALNLSSTFITDRSVDMFMHNTLPSMKALKNFSFNVSNTQVSPAKQSMISQVTTKYLFNV